MAIASPSDLAAIESILGDDAESLLSHKCTTIPRDRLHLPGPGLRRPRRSRPATGPSRCCDPPDALRPRPPRRHGLPLDPARRPGHRALRGRVVRARTRTTSIPRTSSSSPSRAAATPWPRRSACSGAVAPQVRAPDPVPGEDQPQRVPDLPEQVRPDHVRVGQAGADMGAVGGRRDDLLRLRRSRRARSQRSPRRSRRPTSSAWRPCSGATCATPRSRAKDGGDYHVAADLTGQANHLGVTIQADIIKQKLPENNGGSGVPRPEASARPTSASTASCMTDHPIDLTRYQVANCYMGRAGLINSGGASRARATSPSRADRRHQQARRRHGPDLAAARRSSGRWPRASSC